MINMWTEQETKRYEEHLEKHWTREGKRVKYNPLCEQYKAQIKAMEYSHWTLASPELKDPQKRLDQMVRDMQKELVA